MNEAEFLLEEFIATTVNIQRDEETCPEQQEGGETTGLAQLRSAQEGEQS